MNEKQLLKELKNLILQEELLQGLKKIVYNADKWITVKPNGEEHKGKHLLLKGGESPKEAIQRTYGQKHLFKTSEYTNKTDKKELDKQQEINKQQNLKYDIKMLNKAYFSNLISYKDYMQHRNEIQRDYEITEDEYLKAQQEADPYESGTSEE